ncbi:MAG: hypothetical protein GX621_14735 [Pirellulaceae bacterium]|nr:hypothetical protein [Pirellulaceae bacterium]
MKTKTKFLVGGCAAAAIIVLALLTVLDYWLFDVNSPLNRDSAFACVYEWGRLSPVPASSTDVLIETTGSMLSREFRLEFTASKSDIDAWLLQSPGTQNVSPQTDPAGWRRYEIDPGGGAQHAELKVSPEGTRVQVRVYWS